MPIVGQSARRVTMQRNSLAVLQVARPVGGGMLKHIATLLRGLYQHGIACAVAAPPEVLRAVGPLAMGVHSLSIEDRPSLRDIRSAAHLAAIVARVRPRVVHAHGFRAAWVCALAGVVSPLPPLVVTVHNLLPPSRRISNACVRTALGHAHTVICITHAVAGSLAGAGIHPRSVAIIPNAVEPPTNVKPRQQMRADLGLPEGIPVVLVVARLVEAKGVDWALKAHAVLRRSIPNAILLLAGDGPDMRALQALAERLGISDAVRFLGARQDVPSLMACADLCMVASVSEGQSIVALEAMAAGTPLVCTDAGGLPETVIHNQTGLVVPAQNATALASAATALLTNREQALSLALTAKQEVARAFDWRRMVADTVAVYRAATDRSNTS